MKICNDLVEIKMGRKKYEFKNLILNNYLKRFAEKQLDMSGNRNFLKSIRLNYCFFKFDEPITNLNENTELTFEDFDICAVDGAKTIIQDLSEGGCSIKYTYEFDWVMWDYNKHTATDNFISNYYGKKVTAIGFFTHWLENASNKACAVLDTSNYNIYLQENQGITITRKDIITSDALFWSSNKEITGPLHLAPIGGTPLLEQKEEWDVGYTIITKPQRTYGILNMIGFSNFINEINEEITVNLLNPTISEKNELSFDSIENYYNENSLYSSNTLYPGEVYAERENYKYVVFKYKVYQEVVYVEKNENGEYEQQYIVTDTGAYYLQSIEIKKYGLSNLKIKYERSLKNV
ncbi:MAG: hypothetical protein J6K45_06550 [Clostridia bacterium]|nr:hypothetical protein [Clostridia bacterium]